MASLRLATQASSSGGSEVVTSHQFPAGMRVLAVDDDAVFLKILEKKLHRCSYEVTICTQAAVALNMLRERKGCFDIILSDVHMPDMDGYKLLEQVGLEMNVPVIMMSADGSTGSVLRGIKHGACDYLIKPLREEELKNIWQHVIRKKEQKLNNKNEHSGYLEVNDRQRHKRKNANREYDDTSALKKPRVVWSLELHDKFISAVNQIGLNKAVPRRILELMNVPGLTRENIASHLQKYRLSLKENKGASHQQGRIPNMFYGSVRSYQKQPVAASSQVLPQSLVQGELFLQPASSLVTWIDQGSLLQSPLPRPGATSVEHGVAGGSSNVSSGFGVWPSSSTGMVGADSNVANSSSQSRNLLMDASQLKQQQQQNQFTNPSTNDHPSLHVVPAQSSVSFHMENDPPFDQSSVFEGNVVTDYKLDSPHSFDITITDDNLDSPQSFHISFNIGQSPHKNPGTSSAASGYISATSLPSSPTVASSGQMSRLAPNVYNLQTSSIPSHFLVDQSATVASSRCQDWSLNYNKQTCSIPSDFAVDEFNLPMGNLSCGQLFTTVRDLVEEPTRGHVGSSNLEAPILPQYSSYPILPQQW